MTLPLYGSALLQLIPQRPPIVMVDTLLDYTPTHVVTALRVDKDNIFVQDDIFQESGLLEHMAQTVAIHTGYSFFLRNEDAPTGYIGAIQKADIIRLPQLGDLIESEAEILQEFMGVTLVNIISKIDNFTIATAQMKTVIASI